MSNAGDNMQAYKLLVTTYMSDHSCNGYGNTVSNALCSIEVEFPTMEQANFACDKINMSNYKESPLTKLALRLYNETKG
jgi:hypothetical protein